MRLADETTFTLGHEVITLRASLRAAIRLERQFGGFDKIVKAIAAGNLSVMSTVIRESSIGKTDLADLLDCGGALSIKVAIDELHEPLTKHVMALAGVDPDSPAQKSPVGEAVPFPDFYARLYRIATGWLGWSPDDALNATTTEILEAHKGRVELLGAIFGNGKKDDGDKAVDLSKGRMDKSTRDRLNAIGNMQNRMMPQCP
jgi:hypothetical protein